MIGSTAAVERGPSEGARSGSKEPTWVPFLPLGFRRRPIQFSVPAAVEAGEAVAGFTTGIRHGRKGNGGVVKGAGGLLVKEMHFGHHGERGDVPRWGRLLYSRDFFRYMAALTLRFVGPDVGIVQGVIGDIHRPTASRLGAGQMFML